MRIAGLQKVTLLDYPGKIACTVFLHGCNLRCPYCHNPSLVLSLPVEPEMQLPELTDFLLARQGKLDGVCVTGGEPTLYAELPTLLREIRKLGFAVKLDTNGTNPQMLQQILQQELVDYVAMDIKNSPARYVETCGGIDLLHQVQESVAILMRSDIDYEFRTTVCSPLHRPEDLRQIGQWLQGAKRYFLQQFVDSGDLLGDGVKALSVPELEQLHQSVLPYIPNTQIRGI